MQSLKRFVLEDDISKLYSFIFDENPSIKLPGQPMIHNKNEFTDWLVYQLQGFYHNLYLIYDDYQIKGFLLSFDYRIYDGHCQIYGFLDNDINYDLFKKYVCFLCSEYPLRKIFLQVTKEDMMVQSAKKLGFFEEACLKEYKYIEGQYVDLYVLSYLTRGCIDGR